MYSPAVDDTFEFEGHVYRFPAARPGANFPIEIEGGRATVIRAQRVEDGTFWALKQFKPKYRTRNQVNIVQRLKNVSSLPGLLAASQSVIDSNSPLARSNPDLEWAVLMPWISGDTWGKMLGDVQQRKRTVSRSEAEMLSGDILRTLVNLEKRAIVHCDLSGGNVLVGDRNSTDCHVQLVDLEGMLIHGTAGDTATPGTTGYALPGVQSTACHAGDRYAGIIIAAEALAIALPYDERLVSSEGVFRGNREVGDADARHQYVHSRLVEWMPRFAALLLQAWNAPSLEACAPLETVLSSLMPPVVKVPGLPVHNRFGDGILDLTGASSASLSGPTTQNAPAPTAPLRLPDPSTAAPSLNVLLNLQQGSATQAASAAGQAPAAPPQPIPASVAASPAASSASGSLRDLFQSSGPLFPPVMQSTAEHAPPPAAPPPVLPPLPSVNTNRFDANASSSLTSLTESQTTKTRGGKSKSAPAVTGAGTPAVPSNAPSSLPTLYDRNAAFLAAVIGLPLAGSVCLGINYGRKGQPFSAFMSVLLGGVGSAVIIAMALMNMMVLAVCANIALAAGIRGLTDGLQGGMLMEHEAAGGAKGSPWFGAVVGVISLATVSVLIAVLLMLQKR